MRELEYYNPIRDDVELETYKNFVIDRSHSWPHISGAFIIHDFEDRSLKSVGKKKFQVTFQSTPQDSRSGPYSAWTERGAIVAAAKNWNIESSASWLSQPLRKRVRELESNLPRSAWPAR